MMKGSKFFDKNPAVQGRFEELEDWCEELENKIYKLNKRLKRQARKSEKEYVRLYTGNNVNSKNSAVVSHGRFSGSGINTNTQRRYVGSKVL